MIAEFLQLQSAILQRAVMIGRILIAHKHWGCYGHPVRLAAPFLEDVCDDGVRIAVGMTKDGAPCSISVPAELFETGSDGAIRTWITRSNEEHAELAENRVSREEELRRAQEISILHELMKRYPQEAASNE